jgi:methylase of polypeptide subunit release factors
MSAPPPRTPPRPHDLEPLRSLLLAKADDVRDALGDSLHLGPTFDFKLSERRLADDSSEAAVLAKLFLLSVPVPLADAVRALAPVEVETLVASGLVAVEGGEVRPLVRLPAYEGLLVASDPWQEPQPADFVTGPSPVARRVERLTTRRSVRSALDLGTGPGIQALRAARHSERVIAVDVSERAVAFARFNAGLNGATNLDVRHGSWFEPVEGDRFDLIVANPPYVVSPETEFLYRDGDLPADAVTQKLLQEAPAHLEEGGFAHVIGDWIHGRDEDWRSPVEGWLAGSGCDALLLRYGDVDLVSYAALWNAPVVAEGAESFLSAVDRWLDHYRREGIEAISHGVIVLRRRSGGRNWVRAIEVPGSPTGPAGDHLLRLFEARDRRDEASLSARFVAAPGLKLSWSAEGPAFQQGVAKVGLEHGIGFAVRVSPAFAAKLPTLAELGPDELATARRLHALGLLELP